MAEVQELVRSDAAVALREGVGTGELKVGKPFSRSSTAGKKGQQLLRWNAPHPVASSVALKTAVELEKLWDNQGGAIADVPAVNFEKSMVLAVFAGEGFFREVPSIERVKFSADEVVVHVSRFSRPWSKHNAKAVIQVPQTELPIRFVYLS